MGRGSADSSNVLFGKPLRRKRKAVEVTVGSPERDFWLVGDAATWYPRWTGPVDVVLVRVDEERGRAKAKITTPDIEETGEVWEVQLTELEPRESPLAPADPNDPDDKRFEVGE